LFWLPERLEPAPVLPRDRAPELPPVADTLTAAEPDTEVVAAVSDTVAPSAVLTTVVVGATIVALVLARSTEVKPLLKVALVSPRYSLLSAAPAVASSVILLAPTQREAVDTWRVAPPACNRTSVVPVTVGAAEMVKLDPEASVMTAPPLFRVREVPEVLFRTVAELSMVNAPPLPAIWEVILTPVLRRSTVAPPTVFMVAKPAPVRVAPVDWKWSVLELPVRVDPAVSSPRVRAPELIPEVWMEVATAPARWAPVESKDSELELPEKDEPAPEEPRAMAPELAPIAATLIADEPEMEVVEAVRDTVAPSAVLTTVAVGATMVAPVESKVRELELAEARLRWRRGSEHRR